MEEIAAYEERFRRAGLPLFIEGYTAASDVFTRASPLLVLVFLAETLGAIDLQWSLAANAGAVAGGVGILVGAYALANRIRGRRWTAAPDRVGRVEQAIFVVVPALLPLIFGGQRTSAVVTLAANALLLVLLWLVVGYGLPAILRGASARLVSELATSLATLTRAVPLLMLFAAVLFLSTELWQVLGTTPPAFLVAAGVLVVAVGVLFIVVRLPGEVARLEHEAAGDRPLSRRQRVNVALIMLVSHALQVVIVTLAVAAFFVVFGALVVGPEVRQSWLGSNGDVLLTLDLLGERTQITAELLRVAGGVAGLSGLYYAIAVLTDDAYRDQFLDRLSTEMRTIFEARREYLTLRSR